MRTGTRQETERAIAAAIARARSVLERATRENVFRYVVEESDGFGSTEVSVVSDAWYQETCREDDCRAVLWSYRDEHGIMRAAVETARDWS
jgi:hypothetical protein